MLITAIERTKKGRYSIFCDGEFICALHPDIFASTPIKTGGSISVGELEDLRNRSELKITKDRALRLLSARPYTSYGLKQKLIAYTDEESADSVVARMIELGLLDDLDYARRFAEECIARRGYSHSRAKQALREKGIGRDIIDQVLDERDDDTEPAIAKVILRKYIRYLNDEKGLAKTTNGLLRLGYRYGDIRQVIDNLIDDVTYYDDW